MGITYLVIKGIAYMTITSDNAKEDAIKEKSKEESAHLKKWSRLEFAMRSDRARLLKSKRLPSQSSDNH